MPDPVRVDEEFGTIDFSKGLLPDYYDSRKQDATILHCSQKNASQKR
jgi:hypothetical protein